MCGRNPHPHRDFQMDYYILADPGGLYAFLSLGNFLNLPLECVHIALSDRYHAFCMIAMLGKVGTSLGKEGKNCVTSTDYEEVDSYVLVL